MNEAQRALLQMIHEGNYLPCLHADLTVLAWLFRNEYVRYAGWNVQITAAGKTALQEAVSHAAR